MKNAILLGILTGVQLFAADTAPDNAPAILQQKCGQCHGASSGMSGLKVTSRENLLKGGSRGAALIPGKSADSLLYKA
jgi:mono/diheme cytochrome c family protein